MPSSSRDSRPRRLTVALLALLLGGAPACGTDDGGDRKSASITLDLASLAAQMGGLTAAEVRSFRVLVHQDTPPGPDLLFDSGCQPFGGTAFKVDPLEAGSGRSLSLAAYADDGCAAAQIKYRAYRGDVIIDPEEDRIYVLFPYRVGSMTALPVPSPASMDRAAKTACDRDADCREEVHQAAFCTSSGRCALTSLHPLNRFAPRALHASASLADGSVVSVGGIGQAAPGTGALLGTDITLERFLPERNLFEVTSISEYSARIRLALHDTVALADGRLVVVGGLQSLILARAGDTLSFTLPSEVCSAGNDCAPNLINHVTVLDFEDERAITSTLPQPLAWARTMPLALEGPDSDPQFLVTGGLVIDGDEDKVVPSDHVFRCTVRDDDDPVRCTELDVRMSAPRAGHAVHCLDGDADGGCHKVLIAGGHGVDDDDVADVYDHDARTLAPLTRRGEGKAGGGWALAEVGGVLLTLGGSTGGIGAPPDLDPQVVRVNGERITIQPVDLGDLPDGAAHRVFAATAHAGDGALLMIGGLDQENNATRSVLRFRVGSGDGADAVDVERIQLAVARFGHTAVAIERGPLAGSVLVQGGLVLRDNVLQFAGGDELYATAP